MISETTFIHAENLPDIMRGTFDRPWNFIGEVKLYFQPEYVKTYCCKCNGIPLHKPLCEVHRITVVHLEGFLFITDDMIEVMVYFGICPECDSIYWMRQGPPFQRARYLAPATT